MHERINLCDLGSSMFKSEFHTLKNMKIWGLSKWTLLKAWSSSPVQHALQKLMWTPGLLKE